MGYKLGDHLQEAFDKKNNDINSFVWKYPKERYDQEQESIKLIDCSESLLQRFYAHCNTMLYNEDQKNLGRHNVIKLIESQDKRIGVELLLREMEEDNSTFSRYSLVNSIETLIYKQNSVEPGFIDPNVMTIGQVITGSLSSKYSGLPIQLVMDGCTDQLGVFSNSHITKSFILRRGVCPDREDNKTLAAYAKKFDIDTKSIQKIDLIKRYLRVEDQMLKFNPKGLSVADMKLMLSLRPKKIKDMPTRQLSVLRYRILFDLKASVREHIATWEELKRQIEKVAEAKGFKL